MNVDGDSAPPPRLPRWRTATVPRSVGRMTPDWALVLPIPASIAAHRDVLFTPFGDAVPLVHCLRTAEASGRRTGEAVVAVADVLYPEVKALLTAEGMDANVVPVSGLGTPTQCLSAGLAVLGPTTRYVLVHDVHRPLASTDLADRVLDDLRLGNDVVVPALAMVDSVKTVDSAGTVTATVDRTLLQSAQFPRGFERRRLATILGVAGDGDLDELITAAQRADVPCTVVEGDPDAFALDIPRDVELADAIYACRLAEQR